MPPDEVRAIATGDMTAEIDYYERLSGSYDILKASDDLEAWVRLVQEAIGPLAEASPRLLDVGCGTGASSRALSAAGFDVTGCDASAEMLTLAAAKCPDLTFKKADMRALPTTLGLFDVVNFTGDVLNHLCEPSDLKTTLRSVRAVLADHGTVVFDVNTLSTYREMFSRTHAIEREHATFLWVGETCEPTPNGRASLRIVAFEEGPSAVWRRTEARLAQRHYDHDTISEALEEADLDLEAVYGVAGRTLVQPASEQDHHKLIYVARPAANN